MSFLRMIFSIAVIALFGAETDGPLVFWFETLALLSFGISWLTKGEALFADKVITAKGR